MLGMWKRMEARAWPARIPAVTTAANSGYGITITAMDAPRIFETGCQF
jgi:hypothetical protein